MTSYDSHPLPTSVLGASPIYNDQCDGSYTHSLLQLQAALYQRGIGFEYAWTKSSSLITIARNLLANWFLKRTTCSHLLFIDADMVFRGSRSDISAAMNSAEACSISPLYQARCFDLKRWAWPPRQKPAPQFRLHGSVERLHRQQQDHREVAQMHARALPLVAPDDVRQE